MNVSVVIPWRPAPGRVELFEAVKQWWGAHFPDFDVIPSDSGQEQFSRGASRNAGVAEASRRGSQVVVVADADTIPEPAAIAAAVEGAAVDGQVHWPFDRCLYLDESQTAQYLAGGHLPPGSGGGASGGVVVASPQAWLAVGGQDERFRGWGGEDDAFRQAATKTVGAVTHPGRIVCLHHESRFKVSAEWHHNKALALAYRAADREGINRLIEERDMPVKVFIHAAGPQHRWDRDRFGVSKHLVRLCGEPLLHRTVRLIKEMVPDADIRIVVADTADDDYRVPGTRRVKAKVVTGREGNDKILSSSHLWNQDGRTVILFGDVFFTEEAMASILTDQQPWAIAARFGPSSITGCKHGEPFALMFDASEHATIIDAAHRVEAWLTETDQKVLWTGTFTIYHAACGVPDAELYCNPDPQHWNTRDLGRNRVIVDDWTEDMDTGDDWDRWCWKWAHRKA